MTFAHYDDQGEAILPEGVKPPESVMDVLFGKDE